MTLGQTWRDAIGADRPVVVAASTRDGEEAMILEVLHRIDVTGLLVVIVPRHPQRFDAVAALLDERGIRYRRRSEGAMPAKDCAVWLGDSMGEMAAYYSACDVAFVGGSLRPFGSHNVVEPCALGRPVIVGPSVFNFQEAVDLGVAAGAVLQVPDAAALADAAAMLLRDPAMARRMGESGSRFARNHQGAVERLMALIDWSGVDKTE